jgi:AcrR family transcriptional regulator
MFKAAGYGATTMRQLANRLGMEAASLYNHIHSKEELLQEICFGVAVSFTTHFDELEQERLLPLAFLEKLLRFHVEWMITRFDAVYVSQRDWKHLKEPHLANYLQQRRHYEQRMEAVVSCGIEAGTIRAVHPHVAVLTLLAGVRSIEFWHRHPGNITAAQFSEDLVTLLLKGLTAD